MNKAIFFGWIFTLSFSIAQAAEMKWIGEVKIGRLDCQVAKVDGIVVSGPVTLVHPDDSNPNGAIKEIVVECPKLTFEEGSSLTTISSLDIRISNITSGPVKIINIRGVHGADAKIRPDTYTVRKMQSGNHGSHGERGRDGQHGSSISLPTAESGNSGLSAGNVVFISNQIADIKKIFIDARGGNGGKGGKGWRGADGGDGGNGGSGADGGNGGNGSDGGKGGSGGDGGNGGNVTVAISEDNQQIPEIDITNAGGAGGQPGQGGRGGRGGVAGAGTKNGSHGLPGKAGPIGKDGRAGIQGRIGISFSGVLPKEVLERLLTIGSR